MDIHKNARTTPHSRAELVRRVLEEGQTRTAVAAAFGVSTRTVRTWVERFLAEPRAPWREQQSALAAEWLVFIDETWAKDNTTRLYGRCRWGQRLVGKIPLARWHTTTFIAALRHDRISAPMVLNGPIDGAWFLAYVEQVLAPTLIPGDIVVLDNLGFHRSEKIREIIAANGASLIYLPKYSPDLNPIENAFAKLKAGLRHAAERSTDALWNRIGTLLHSFTPEECANYFKAAGYAPT